jgi:glycosyltransferase involved in cell wall biosynthesis
MRCCSNKPSGIGCESDSSHFLVAERAHKRDRESLNARTRLFCHSTNMKEPNRVYVQVWTGKAGDALACAEKHYPGCEVVLLPAGQLSHGDWKVRVKILRQLRAAALIFFFDSIKDKQQLELILWSGLIHRCHETVIADGKGFIRVIRRRDWLRLFPKTFAAVLTDAAVFSVARTLLPVLRGTAHPEAWKRTRYLSEISNRIAYLYLNPLDHPLVGGAMSHVRGVLSGLAQNGIQCDVFSGCPLPVEGFHREVIPTRNRPCIFWESLLLSYNVRFARLVRGRLAGTAPAAFYQRHGRFMLAGALLARRMKAPLILEYNASEVWCNRYWEPGRFSRLLALGEETALAHASLVVVVSEPLKQELLQRGIPEHRILVNPNGVDTDFFRPGVGNDGTRRELGVTSEDILVTFVGTFGPWHGVEVLQQAIQKLLAGGGAARLRFLFAGIGAGALYQKVRDALAEETRSGKVIFAGLVPREQIRDYLDASDITVAPHTPMPDGSEFFGSPTKLFEYMAMGKAIVASRLNQIGDVLSHRETALLVEPGSVEELCSAIQEFAYSAQLRERLGKNARRAAVEHHSWRENARRLLERMPTLQATAEMS